MDNLRHLMGAYFHQDWVMDGGKSADTVASFLRERRELVVACADEIDEVLRQDFAEGELAAQLDAWGCDYYAGDADQDYKRWLDEIRQQIRAACRENH